jgi:hypothetical protein
MDVLVVFPVMGCLVTAFNDGVSAESKVILTSWSLAKTSRATTAGEGAEQEYDTNGILISNLMDNARLSFVLALSAGRRFSLHSAFQLATKILIRRRTLHVSVGRSGFHGFHDACLSSVFVNSIGQ